MRKEGKRIKVNLMKQSILPAEEDFHLGSPYRPVKSVAFWYFVHSFPLIPTNILTNKTVATKSLKLWVYCICNKNEHDLLGPAYYTITVYSSWFHNHIK